MNSKTYLDDIYKDFFGDKDDAQYSEVKTEEKTVNIDNLYLTESSKETLIKILDYIKNYDKTKKYLNFDTKLISSNKELLQDIVTLLLNSSSSYFMNNKDKEISILDNENINDVEKAFNEYGIIILTNLDSLSMKDTKYIKRLQNILDTKSNRVTTILFGNKEDISLIYGNDLDLESSSINFCLEEVKPKIEDIIIDIENTLTNYEIKLEDRENLYNYINKTFNETKLSYPKYRDNLLDYISFNNKIPEVEKERSIDDVFNELNSLVGLTKVKKSLYDLVDLITLKNKTKDDLKISNINLHMVFLGNPGTGKTTVARMISSILYSLKYIKQDKLIEVSSKDLVAEYVGQTGPKTMDVVNRAMGGVLFIDEAYALSDDGTNSYNKEAIATLIKAMEDYRDNLVVIFAGYSKEMQDFLNSNSGIVSRIGYTFEFEDYTKNELVEIFKGMAKKSGFIVSDDAIGELEKIIDENINTKNFGNARFVRNVFEKSVIKHATNTKNNTQKKKLKTLVSADITL